MKPIALSIFAMKELTVNSGTVRLDLALTGKWRGHPAGEFEITTEDLAQMVANFDMDIPIDFEHATLGPGPAPAAGWVKELSVEEDRLSGEVEWLDSTKPMIPSQYKYLSPVLEKGIDPVTGESVGWRLHSVALTNTPFLKELGQIRANKHNPHQSQEDEVTEEEAQALRDENAQLKQSNTTMQGRLEELEKQQAEAAVGGAIAAKKITKEQESWALKYATDDPKGFAEFLENQKPRGEVPPSNIFPNSKEGEDVVIPMGKM